MSDAVTALDGASYSAGIATVTEHPLQGMITLRGDLTDPALAKAVNAATGKAVPGQRVCTIDEGLGAAWMSPDELLLLVPYQEVSQCLAAIHKALGKTHALAVNVSDARSVFTVSGEHAHEVLAKLCPVDLSPDVFTSGQIRRTRMAQVPAALWRSGTGQFSVICFRSQARYVFDLLCIAAQPGSQIGKS